MDDVIISVHSDNEGRLQRHKETLAGDKLSTVTAPKTRLDCSESQQARLCWDSSLGEFLDQVRQQELVETDSLTNHQLLTPRLTLTFDL